MDEVSNRPKRDIRWTLQYLDNWNSIFPIMCPDTSFGTGWIALADPDCYYVGTARHVVEAAISGETITLGLLGGVLPFTAVTDGPDMNFIAVDWLDLAVLRVEGQPRGDVLKLTQKDRGEVGVRSHTLPGPGMEVAWMGFPGIMWHATKGFYLPTLGRGHVCAAESTGNIVKAYVFGNINQGMSGGTAWDEDGEVFGVISAFLGPNAQPQSPSWPGYGVIISVGYLLDFIVEMRERRKSFRSSSPIVGG